MKKICIILSILMMSIFSVGFDKTEKYYDVPIIMYHSISTIYNNDYVVSPKQFENDIKYLVNNGYQTIFPSDLIKFQNNDDYILPEKSIIITFDDGFYNNFYYGMPILKKYNCKGFESPVCYYMENYGKDKVESKNYAYLTLENLIEMEKSNIFEIGNHTYNLHSPKGRKGATRKKGESFENYRNVLTKDLSKAQAIFENKGIKSPQIFTCPYGDFSKDTIQIIKEMGFKGMLTCSEGHNKITKTSSLFQLRRYNRPSGISTTSFFKDVVK